MKKRGNYFVLLTLFVLLAGSLLILNTEIQSPTGLAVGEIHIQTGGDCNGAYSGSGDFNITGNVTCDNEIVIITGNITVGNGSTPDSYFAQGEYDLRTNSANITITTPDLLRTTPATYTGDWDSNVTHEFLITMNETDNELQIWLNLSDSSDYIYFIDVDGNRSSGVSGLDTDVDGTEVVVGKLNGVMGVFCWNLSDDALASIVPNGSKCDANYDSGITTNTTGFTNNTATTAEIVLDVDGSWKDKYIGEVVIPRASDGYTTFRNSTILNTRGNLTLINATLYLNVTTNLSRGITIKSNGGVHIKNNSRVAPLDNQTNYMFVSQSSDISVYNSTIDEVGVQKTQTNADSTIGLTLTGVDCQGKTIIERSTISNVDGYLLYMNLFTKNCTIINNTFISSVAGILLKSGSQYHRITGNNFNGFVEKFERNIAKHRL